MPRRRFDLSRPDLGAGIAAIMREAGERESFPPKALHAAEATRAPDREGVDLPLVTVDPPGSRDLDQALHIEPTPGGCRVHYAIADVGAMVAAGTVYAPESKAPLYRAAAVGRRVIDLVEALILAGREGQRLTGTVIDEETVQPADPAVRAPVAGGCPGPGSTVEVELLSADPATRAVSFAVR